MAERQAHKSKTDEPLVILCRIGQYQHAEMMQQMLEAEGIHCTVDGGNSSAVWGPGAEAPFSAKVMVGQHDRAKAVKILKALEAETGHKFAVTEEE
jgi:hypothetical protein